MSHFLKLIFYFLIGAVSTALVLVSASYLIFVASYKDKLYPGVEIPATSIRPNLQINFVSPSASVSVTASELYLRPNTPKMTAFALSIGRQTKNPYYNLLQIFAAWQGKISIPLEISLDESILNQKIDSVAPLIEKTPVDAIFQFNPTSGPDHKGRVEAFSPSQNGLTIDRNQIKQEIISRVKEGVGASLTVPLYTKVLLPVVPTTAADSLGLKNFLGRGQSYFYDSIPGRVYNIKLGTEKITGSLLAPNEIFSFNTAIGTVSAVFGFQKAYAIKEGKTVLDDGGGVCQVSTTLYRAVLNAGLPVIERFAHSYRVGYYEQGGFKPGLDATVYPPSPDFRFKNDTGGHILIQAIFEPQKAKLTFELFGTTDDRQTVITGPFILSTSPPPEPIYEDDPGVPLGEQKRVDTAHPGAQVYFTRLVTRNSEVFINETVRSNYIPWPARFLRGTKI